jgi:hypothetical protein
MGIINFDEIIAQSLRENFPASVSSFDYRGINPVTESMNGASESDLVGDGSGRRYFLWGISYWEEDEFNGRSDVVNK